MALVARDSRNRVGINWYDSEAEAREVADAIPTIYSAETIRAANLGFVQVGRDTGFDREVNGQKQAKDFVYEWIAEHEDARCSPRPSRRSRPARSPGWTWPA